jgi:hypothetical protein
MRSAIRSIQHGVNLDERLKSCCNSDTLISVLLLTDVNYVMTIINIMRQFPERQRPLPTNIGGDNYRVHGTAEYTIDLQLCI